VTFHLADSLPKGVLDRLDEEIRDLPMDLRVIERRQQIEAWIDAGHGSCVLREPVAAAVVQSALLYFDAGRYHLMAWVVMPNHVHVLFQPLPGWTMGQIVASWKKFTARSISASRPPGIGVPGETSNLFWHREYWDRYIRNERHFRQTVQYIHENPVKAGLAAKAEDWRWSSAFSKR
jgi:REP element-mobilizing transposase RayT